jgi:hypothetical protein
MTVRECRFIKKFAEENIGYLVVFIFMGAGASGMTAALYALRNGYSLLF